MISILFYKKLTFSFNKSKNDGKLLRTSSYFPFVAKYLSNRNLLSVLASYTTLLKIMKPVVLLIHQMNHFDRYYDAYFSLGIHHRLNLFLELLDLLFNFWVFWRCSQTQSIVIFSFKACFASGQNASQCQQIHWFFSFSFWTTRTEGQMMRPSIWEGRQRTSKTARLQHLWDPIDTVEGKEVNWERRPNANLKLLGKCKLQSGLNKINSYMWQIWWTFSWHKRSRYQSLCKGLAVQCKEGDFMGLNK